MRPVQQLPPGEPRKPSGALEGGGNELEKWLEAAATIAGADVMTQTIAEVEGDEAIDNVIEEGNMADATKRILGIFPKGIGHAQSDDEDVEQRYGARDRWAGRGEARPTRQEG